MSLTNAWIVPDCDTVLDWLSSIAEDRSSGFLRKMDTPRNLTLILWTLPFLRAMLGISRHAVSVRPSVCPSACPSRSCILSKRLNISSNFLTSNSHTIRVLHTKRYGSIPTEPPPNGSVQCMWSRQKSRFSANIWLCWALWTVRPPNAIHTDPLDRGKLMTLVAGKRPRLFFTGDDDEVFMTRSLNVTPKTTEQHLVAHTVVNLKPK